MRTGRRSEPPRRDSLDTSGASPKTATPRLQSTTAPLTAQLVRIRTLTAGVPLVTLDDLSPVRAALDTLEHIGQQCTAAGYEVQTIRIALPPLVARLSPNARETVLAQLIELDTMVAARGAVVSLGPVLMDDRPDPQLPTWARRLVMETRVTSFSVMVATLDDNVLGHTLQTAAEVVLALSTAGLGGIANFRFAAAACVPAGTPFFPVAWHEGPALLSVGLETPRLLLSALAEPMGDATPETRLRAVLDRELAPVASLAQAAASAAGWEYGGIDPSPAPGMDSSIGAVIEALRSGPFGGAGTLAACATLTSVLKSLSVQTCGYAGLMLPVLEDLVLARRAMEQRFTVRDLLLYSSVCGTGLDVVPLAGDVAVGVLARTIGDTATMAARLRKPLAARLFPVPGAKVGDAVSFDDPLLAACVAMAVD